MLPTSADQDLPLSPSHLSTISAQSSVHAPPRRPSPPAMLQRYPSTLAILLQCTIYLRTMAILGCGDPDLASSKMHVRANEQEWYCVL